MQDVEETLLLAIARHRDREAFEELVSRFEKQAFMVSLRIVGSRALAEEAVQEAFLRVWLSAPTYRPAGNPRGWLFSIVANKSLMALRAVKKTKHEREDAAGLDVGLEEQGRVEVMEGRELAGACRVFYGRLPSSDQRLLALHYACGLSRSEISRALGIPVRTVADRVNNALDKLRVSLRQAGFVSGAPILEAELLCQSILAEGSVPSGLKGRVLARIDSLNPAAFRKIAALSPGEGAAGAIGTGLLFPGLLLAIGVASGALFVVSGPGDAARPSGKVETQASLTSVTLPIASIPSQGREPFHKLWTFEESRWPKGFERVAGDWGLGNWPIRHVGVLAARSPQEYSALLLPGEIPPFPFVIEAEWTAAGFGTGVVNIGFDLTDGKRLFRMLKLGARPAGLDVGALYSRKWYFLGSRVFELSNGKIFTYAEYEGPTLAANRICLLGKNVLVVQIEWRGIPMDEVPPECLDTKSLWGWKGYRTIKRPGGLLSELGSRSVRGEQ